MADRALIPCAKLKMQKTENEWNPAKFPPKEIEIFMGINIRKHMKGNGELETPNYLFLWNHSMHVTAHLRFQSEQMHE